MHFQVGNQVIHWTLGLGEVVGVEERSLSGESALYYLVRIKDLTVFVPADNGTECRLRSPSAKRDFQKMLGILSQPGTELAENRFERKAALRQEMADGKPESVFRVVRDLTFRARTKNLNDDDKNILERALSLLRSEMALALSVHPEQAEQELQKHLHPLEVAVT
jgi:RNA polymerase-interacting CarD/CdnL/TRCF family regulator